MKNLSCYKMYNGCNHNITFYGNYLKYAMTRKEKFFLTEEGTKPDYVIRQMRPLCIRNTSEKKENSLLLAPEVFETQIDIAPNYNCYDVIVVSYRYATFCYKQFPAYVDYIDRLFVPVKLYDKNPEKEKASVVGCVGFQKYCYPKTPEQYVIDINNGYKPSKAAVEVCCELYNNPCVSKTITDRIWISQLINYVNTEE